LPDLSRTDEETSNLDTNSKTKNPAFTGGVLF
jgi:hypothetical protein